MARTLNPLSCSGTSMAPNTLLVAKFMYLLLLADGFLPHIGRPLAPALPWLEHLRSTSGASLVEPALFLAAGACLLLNRLVRTASIVAGGIALLTMAESLAAWSAHVLFAGVVLVLCGFQRRGEQPWFVRVQIVLVYLASAIEQGLSPDWRDGTLIQRLTDSGSLHATLGWLDHRLPAGSLALVLAWTIIAVEIVLAITLLPRATRTFAVWTGVIFHLVVRTIWATEPVGFFSLAMGAAYLSFLRWPKGEIAVLWPRACGLPLWLRIALDRFDWDARLAWPFPPDPDADLEVQHQHRFVRSRRAICDVLLYFPAFHFAVFAVLVAAQISLPEIAAIIIQVLVVGFLLVFFAAPTARRWQYRMKERSGAAHASSW